MGIQGRSYVVREVTIVEGGPCEQSSIFLIFSYHKKHWKTFQSTIKNWFYRDQIKNPVLKKMKNVDIFLKNYFGHRSALRNYLET